MKKMVVNNNETSMRMRSGSRVDASYPLWGRVRLLVCLWESEGARPCRSLQR